MTIYKNEAAKKRLLDLYDERLANLNIDYQDIYIETKTGGKTHIVAAGNPKNPPIIALHGINAGAPLALEALKGLLNQYYIYAIDTVGQVTKSSEQRLSFKDNSYGIWLNEVLEELGVENIPVLGASYGGFLLQTLIIAAPEKISKAIFIVPGGFVNGAFWPSLKNLSWPLMRFLWSKKDKHLKAFLNAFYNSTTQQDLDFQRDLLLHTKMDYRRPPLLTKKAGGHFKKPVYIMTVNEDIFFPGDQAIERCKTIFDNYQDSFILTSKHIPHEATYLEMVPKLRAWLNDKN